MASEGIAGRSAPLARREWALALLLLVAFAPALAAMAEVWTRVEYQSHGFLVPLVSLWVALRERYAWRRLLGWLGLRLPRRAARRPQAPEREKVERP